MSAPQYGFILTGFSIFLFVSGAQFEPYDEAIDEVASVNGPDETFLYDQNDKRGWGALQGSWGKRAAWNSLHGSWGKRIVGLPMDGLEAPIVAFLLQESYPSSSIESLDALNRNWARLPNSSWGKRSSSGPKEISPRSTNWSSLRGSWGKRAADWNQLRGMWGKRATDWDKFRGSWGKRLVQGNNFETTKEPEEKTTQ